MSGPIDAYLALTPTSFPYLRSLTVTHPEGDIEPGVGVTLLFYGAGSTHLRVWCSGARELIFRQPFTDEMKLHGLEVRDISPAQLENLNFEVRDVEDEWLAFKCHTFHAALDEG